MEDKQWPSNVTHVRQMGSQGGTSKPFDVELNAFLKAGWRIIQTWVEDKGPDSSREECICLLGWAGDGEPVVPRGF